MLYRELMIKRIAEGGIVLEGIGEAGNNLGEQLAVRRPAYENIGDPFRVDRRLTG